MSRFDESGFQQLRQRLDARRAELHADIRRLDAERVAALNSSPNNQVEDLGEQGEERIRDAVRHAEKERDLLELREIDAARERLANGVYGSCADCGDEIPRARLEARPSALRCVVCQQYVEQPRPPGRRGPTGA